MSINLSKYLLIIIVFIFLCLGGWVIKTTFIDKPTIVTVIGEGKISTKPEMVKFTVTLVNMADQATEAIVDNKKSVNNVMLVAKSAGITERDMTIPYVRVVPATSTLGKDQYQAINAIDITLKDISKFDKLYNDLYFIKVYSISNIVFTTNNSEVLEKEAVTKALDNAKIRAAEIAKASGKKLGRMLSIQTVEEGKAEALAGEIQATEINTQNSSMPSQIEISRQAAIEFELY